jgi:hypothetical protein
MLITDPADLRDEEEYSQEKQLEMVVTQSRAKQ